MNYFVVLGINPPRLNLSAEELETLFYKASRANHPDKNPDVVEATQRSAEINQAYRTLREPWSRADYVIRSAGLVVDSKLPPALAELYFETQEAEDVASLKRLDSRLEQDRQERVVKLSKVFTDYDSAFDRTKALESLKALVIENKYASSMRRDLKRRLALTELTK